MTGVRGLRGPGGSDLAYPDPGVHVVNCPPAELSTAPTSGISLSGRPDQ